MSNFTFRRVFEHVNELFREKGALVVFRKIFFEWSIQFVYFKLFKSRLFTFQGKNLRYFYHPYNQTWKSERSVEIPIVWDIVKANSGKQILEVGNVLSHYFNVNHDILDKYEKDDGVINEDVVKFSTSKKYDLIVSISTLEHVGWDEEQYAKQSSNDSLQSNVTILDAINNLKQCLSNDGFMIMTLPIGQNPVLDSLVQKRQISFTRHYFLKRVSRDNRWEEVNWERVKDIQYGEPFPHANGVIVGYIEKQ